MRPDRDPAADGWQIPAGTKIAAAGTLLVLCPRGKRKLLAVTVGRSTVMRVRTLGWDLEAAQA